MHRSYRKGLLCAILVASLGTPALVMAQTGGDTSCLTEEQIALVGQDIDAAQAILPDLSRIIPPDTAVTQDFRADRVNVDLDEDGIVIRVWCG